jgi:hypothetical protein
VGFEKLLERIELEVIRFMQGNEYGNLAHNIGKDIMIRRTNQ